MRPRTTAVSVVALLVVLAFATAAPVGGQQSGQVLGYPQLTATTSAGPIGPGTTTDVPLAVTNRPVIERAGPEQYESRVSTARGLVVDVESGDAPVRVDTGQLALGNVPGGASTAGSVSLTVARDAKPGTYELPVEYEYSFTRVVTYDGSGNPEYRDQTVTREGTLEITVDDRPTFEIVNRSSSAVVGQTGQLAVTLRNTGTETATDSRVTITSGSTSMRFASGAESGTSFVGEWEPGETKTVTYEATIADDADPGSYSADLSVGYTDTQGADGTSRTMNLGVPVGDEQEFALRDVESTLRAGYEGHVRGRLVNEGPATVRNPVAVLGADNGGVTITSGDEALSDLGPGEGERVNFTVDVSRSVDSTRQQFALTVNYDTPLGDRRQSSPLRPTVRVAPSQDRFGVTAVNGTVAAGESGPMEFAVTNRGDEPVENVELKAYFNAPLNSDNDEAIVDRLAPGQTKSVVVDVGASSNALAKNYSVGVDFQFERPDGTTEISEEYTTIVRVTDDEGGGFPVLLVVALLALGVGGVFLYRRRDSFGS